MRLREKALYHQIHPLKLGADILSESVSLYFFWQHALLLGLATHFAPPIIASALLLAFGRFDRQKSSKLGRYISRHMTRSVEAARLAGDIVMILGAWYRAPLVIAAGLFVVAIAWLSGLAGSRTSA